MTWAREKPTAYHCKHCGYVDQWNRCWFCLYCGRQRSYDSLAQLEAAITPTEEGT